MTDIIHNPSEDNTIQYDIQCDTIAHIGHNLAAIRRSRGMSQEYVALKLGKSQQTVSNIESMRSVPEELLAQIAMILGVTPDYVKNYDLERVMANNTQIIHDGGKGGFNEFNDHSTNSLDVIKYIVAENERLHTQIINEKNAINKELKTEIRLLKAENKRLIGELHQAKIGNCKK